MQPGERNERLPDRLQEVKLESKGLRGIVAGYERVKRAFGAGEVERAVEGEKSREQAEKSQPGGEVKPTEKLVHCFSKWFVLHCTGEETMRGGSDERWSISTEQEEKMENSFDCGDSCSCVWWSASGCAVGI